MTQSSAKRRMLDVRLAGKSLIYIRNRRGPRTVPWGTPERTGLLEEEWLLAYTNCCLLVKKFRIQFKTRGLRCKREVLGVVVDAELCQTPFRNLKRGHQLECFDQG